MNKLKKLWLILTNNIYPLEKEDLDRYWEILDYDNNGHYNVRIYYLDSRDGIRKYTIVQLKPNQLGFLDYRNQVYWRRNKNAIKNSQPS